MNRGIRKGWADETLKIIDEGTYTNSKNMLIDIKLEIETAVNETQFFGSDELANINDSCVPMPSDPTCFEVTSEDSISSILRQIGEGHTNPMCLNFASAKNPGGGFLNGSIAQEESLAVSSALYACQQRIPEYYGIHRGMKSCIYTDNMIYSPGVPIFRNNSGQLLEERALCTMITCAAVNAGVVKSREPENSTHIEAIMDTRIEKLLSLCVLKKHDVLVLGAWGCGVFRNDPHDIARLFGKHLYGKFQNHFKKVVFAVYSKNERFIQPFKEIFEQ